MENKGSRNLGIDSLRIVSMLMVVFLHVLGKGEILKSAKLFSINYYLAWFLEIAAYCAVNCYALITGYVSINAKYKYSRLISLWMQVFFYSVLITLTAKILVPEEIGTKQVIRSFFPLLSDQYWYFTAYTGMFIFIPFLNRIIKASTKQQLQKLVGAIVIIFSVLPTIARKDLFNTSTGYSTIWLMCLYIIGAYIRLYGFGRAHGKGRYFLSYGICIAAAWCGKLGIDALAPKYPVLKEIPFIKYTSPLILFAGIFMLLFFSQCSIKNKATVKLINIFAPVSFGVYLIHVNELFCKYFLNKKFAGYSKYPFYKMLLYIFGTAVILYVGCSLIEMLRILLFRLLGLNKLMEWFDAKQSKSDEAK